MASDYPVNLSIDYQERPGRVSTFFRGIISIPIQMIVGPVTSSMAMLNYYSFGAPIFIIISLMFFALAALIPAGSKESFPAWIPFLYLAYIPLYLFLSPLIMMILFRKKYPKWWYDWGVNATQLVWRMRVFLLLLTDRYPATDDEQSVHITIEYPDAEKELKRGLPLVKWILAIPHYIVLFFFSMVIWFVTIFAWFAILFTGKYPRELFDFVVGYERWYLRVWTYVALLTTDKYPPFSLN